MDDGWLRVQDSKFWAYSRAKSVIINEATNETLEDFIEGFEPTDILRLIQALQLRIDGLTTVVGNLVKDISLHNVQTGVYSVTEEIIQSLDENDRLDNNVLYYIVDSSTPVSRVTTTIEWLSKDGEVVIDTASYTGGIGEIIRPTVYGIKYKGGIGYRYTPVGSPVIDNITDLVSKQIETPSDPTATVLPIHLTKNVILRLKAV